MAEQEPQTRAAVQIRLSFLLNELENSRSLVRGRQNRLPKIPKKGMYVFYEDGKPVTGGGKVDHVDVSIVGLRLSTFRENVYPVNMDNGRFGQGNRVSM